MKEHALTEIHSTGKTTKDSKSQRSLRIRFELCIRSKSEEWKSTLTDEDSRENVIE